MYLFLCEHNVLMCCNIILVYIEKTNQMFNFFDIFCLINRLKNNENEKILNILKFKYN